jgi:hypothetical protein
LLLNACKFINEASPLLDELLLFGRLDEDETIVGTGANGTGFSGGGCKG